MMKYIVAIIIATIASAALVNMPGEGIIPVGVADVKPGSLGVIRAEGGIGEVKITESARTFHYATQITAAHPERGKADFPHFGNN